VLTCHFLEQLHNDDECKCALEIALNAAGQGIYISGPYFDDDEEARKQGL
jgi:hypothetical protein